jgi:hypothetical protein
MDFGAVGLELGVAGQVLESYHRGKWVRIGSETPTRAAKGGILAIRVAGVRDLYNWDIDNRFFD